MRGFVVIAVLLAGTAIAEAKRIACLPPTSITLPTTAPDATDETPPTAPVLDGVWVEASSVAWNAQLSEDTALLRIKIVDAAGHVETISTTAQHRFLCTSSKLEFGAAQVTVTAVDLAGNASSSDTTAYISPPHDRNHYRCGMGMFALLLFFVPVLAVFIAIGMFIRSAIRRRKLALPGAPIAPLVAETMTRAVIADTLFTIAWGFTLTLMLYFSDDEVWAALVGVLPFVRLVRLALTKRFLGLLENGMPAELHDNLLAVNGYYIKVANRIVKDALARSVPVASIDLRSAFASLRAPAKPGLATKR